MAAGWSLVNSTDCYAAIAARPNGQDLRGKLVAGLNCPTDLRTRRQRHVVAVVLALALSRVPGPERLADSAQDFFLLLVAGLAAFFAAGFFSTKAKELTLNFVSPSALTTVSRVSEPFFMATVTVLALRSTSALFTPAILERVSRTPEAQPPQVIPVTPTT